MGIQDNFKCYGYFYNLTVDEETYMCRSILEIVRKNTGLNKKTVKFHEPNAIVIMMNPGDSIPLEGGLM